MAIENRFSTIRQMAVDIRAERAPNNGPRREPLGLEQVTDEDRRRGFTYQDKTWVGHVKTEQPARNGGRE